MNADNEQFVKNAVSGSGAMAGEIRVDCICQDGQGQDKTLCINVDKGVYDCKRCGIQGSYLKKERTPMKPQAQYFWDKSVKFTTHPYVEKKQIHPNEIMVYTKYNLWIIPFHDRDGKFQTVQRISPEGSKRWATKAKNNGVGPNGSTHKIPGTNDIPYICEGIATGWSIHEATGATVYCVGGKDNFKNVVPWLKEKYDSAIVAADNDSNGDGLRAASKAAFENGLKIVIPPTVGEDFNDYAVAAGLDAAKAVLEDPKEPDPPKQNPSPVADEEYLKAISEMNLRHACIMIGGKFQIMNKFIDPLTGEPEISFSSAFDFKNRYTNKVIVKTVPDENGGEKKKAVPIAEEWLKSPLRREYDGIVFDPSGKAPPEYYNLWKGLSCSPKQGKWNLFEDHILTVIADGDHDVCQWILAWMARIVQDPGGERPGTSLVLRGKMGTGKGIFANFFGRLLGKHFLQLAHASQVTGRFNSHFKDVLFVFVDEGFWAGDKQAEGILKNLITEPFITVEQKGKDIIKVRNHVNLMIATNNTWAVPAGLEERRFFVLDVSDKRKQDHEYFKAIVNQMENGGVEAMLHDLLEMDISQVNLRKFKQTAGLFEQKLYGMDTVQKFWLERLKEGTLIPIDPDLPEQYGTKDWEDVCKKRFYDSYLDFADSLKDRFPLAPQQFGMSLKKMCKGVCDAPPNNRRIKDACL